MRILNESRIDLAKLLYGKGAEIGVEQGIFSEQICLANPGVELYCVDAWQPYKAYRDHRSKDKLDRFFWRSRKRLYKYGCNIVRKPSMEAVKDFRNGELDFVYIDANHAYDFVSADISEWIKKVKSGGIVAGHDYLDLPDRRTFYNVKKAVDDYVQANDIHTLTIYAKDDFPSWMFYKK